jgi:RNA polymerase sigma factor (sigma-70 family)
MMTAKRPPSDTPGAPLPSGIRPSIDPANLFREALSSILKMARNRGFESDSEQRDIAQTVGEALVRHRGDYDPDLGTPIEWTMGIAKNVIREAARRRRTERRFIDAAPSQGMEDQPALDLSPEERARANDALSLIRATLTEEQLDIFELSAEQRTAEEVAGILGVTRSRVEQRIREARERLAALLKRLGEDKASASRVRGAMLPFVTVEDLEAALRAGRVREGVAAELWRRVVERTGYSDGGGEDEPPRGEAPTAPAPRPRAPAPLDAGRAPQLPAAGQLAGPAARVMLSAGQLTAGATLVFLTGAVVGAGILAAVTSDERSAPPSILAEPAPEVVLASTSSAEPEEPAAAHTARSAPFMPAGTVRGAASAPPISTSIDPATADESTLLQMALSAPPRRALDLANQHAQRFPTKQVGKREVLIVRALVALGRRGEAEARARALKGTVYEQAVTDALGGPPP